MPYYEHENGYKELIPDLPYNMELAGKKILNKEECRNEHHRMIQEEYGFDYDENPNDWMERQKESRHSNYNQNNNRNDNRYGDLNCNEYQQGGRNGTIGRYSLGSENRFGPNGGNGYNHRSGDNRVGYGNNNSRFGYGNDSSCNGQMNEGNSRGGDDRFGHGNESHGYRQHHQNPNGQGNHQNHSPNQMNSPNQRSMQGTQSIQSRQEGTANEYLMGQLGTTELQPDNFYRLGFFDPEMAYDMIAPIHQRLMKGYESNSRYDGYRRGPDASKILSRTACLGGGVMHCSKS
jgi:hypothetical protein